MVENRGLRVVLRKRCRGGDDRPWIVTVFDPFDVWGLVRGRDKKMQFWDLSDAELEALRLEKKRNKRSVGIAFLDPFHLWGRTGYVARIMGKTRTGNRAEAQEVQTTQTKRGDMELKSDV